MELTLNKNTASAVQRYRTPRFHPKSNRWRLTINYPAKTGEKDFWWPATSGSDRAPAHVVAEAVRIQTHWEKLLVGWEYYRSLLNHFEPDSKLSTPVWISEERLARVLERLSEVARTNFHDAELAVARHLLSHGIIREAELALGGSLQGNAAHVVTTNGDIEGAVAISADGTSTGDANTPLDELTYYFTTTIEIGSDVDVSRLEIPFDIDQDNILVDVFVNENPLADRYGTGITAPWSSTRQFNHFTLSDGLQKGTNVITFKILDRENLTGPAGEGGYMWLNVKWQPNQFTNLPRHLYTGQQYDQESEQGYFDARYYQADIARFLNYDPARAGTNLFGYVSNNSMNMTDPSGLIGEPVIDANTFDHWRNTVAAVSSQYD